MTTSTVIYTGKLHTELKHTKSGQVVLTDAPTDNNGKGEFFSPTDLCATALATCALTTMGIKADLQGRTLERIEADVYKVMANNPRRIGEVRIDFKFHGNYSAEDKQWLIDIAHNCPVAKSLHPDIKQVFSFSWE